MRALSRLEVRKGERMRKIRSSPTAAKSVLIMKESAACRMAARICTSMVLKYSSVKRRGYGGINHERRGMEGNETRRK